MVGHAFFKGFPSKPGKETKKGIGRDFPRLVNGWLCV